VHNITLVCTAHVENGKCNSNELYGILESIRPEVIFEELPRSLFHKCYEGNENSSEEPLEVRCIRRYLQHQNIEHLPVDIEPSQNLTLGEIDYMYSTIKAYNVYKKLDDEQALLTARGGFTYLNGEECSDLFERKRITEMQVIDFNSNKSQLLRIHKLFHEEHDNRENEMLKNIYEYSKGLSYERAIFMIGAGHRKSIIQKVLGLKGKERPELTWTFYPQTLTQGSFPGV